MHTHTHPPYYSTVVAPPPPQSDFHSSSTAPPPPPDVSHSDSTTATKEPSPPPAPASQPSHPHTADSRVYGADSAGTSGSGHVGGELSEARLEEVASRLVADALSRAVHKCYAEGVGDTGRQVCVYLVWFIIISYTDQGAFHLAT